MTSEENFKTIMEASLCIRLKLNYDIVEYHNKLQHHWNVDINRLNKIDTKIHLLKQEVATGILEVTNILATLCNRLDYLPPTAEVLNIYSNISSILMEHSISEISFGGVYHQENFIILYLKHETRTQFKRRMIKQLNKAKRVNNKCLRDSMKVTRKLERLEKRLAKQDKARGKMVLNCNTWFQGICENKYNNMVHDPVTIEEKRSIEETIKLRI